MSAKILAGMGRNEVSIPARSCYSSDDSRIIRIWTIPVERLLTGGLGTLPLAPLADLSAIPVETVVRRMDTRIRSEASAPEAEQLWASTYLLMGLRFSPEVAAKLTQGVRGMRESTTYQAILEEGREEGMEQGDKRGVVREARELLIRIGTKRFGAPSVPVRATLSSIEDKERLELLVERALDLETWNELLEPNPV